MRNADVEWAISLPVSCRQCGHQAAELLGRLIDREEVGCQSCGKAIDLTSETWRDFLNEFADSIEILRPLYAKLP